MANEAELIEPKIKSSFKKVKTDINSVRAAIRRQNQSITEIRKSFSDTMGRDDFYQFTEKLSARIDDLQNHFVSNDEFAKATEKIAKRMSSIKQAQKQLSGIDLKSEFKRINDSLSKLQENTVQRKDYERLVTNAEHNFNEIAREVEASKEYDRQLKQLNKQVSELTEHKKQSDDRLKQLNTELSALVKKFGSEAKENRQQMDKELKNSDARLSKIESELKKFNDVLAQKAQLKEVDTRISSEIKSLKEDSDFVKLEELNQKIDEFNTILEELQPKEEHEKRMTQFLKERINPLEKDIATISRQQDDMRHSMENTITRFEKRLAGFEKAQDTAMQKFESQSQKQLEERMSEIEKISENLKSGSASGTPEIAELRSQLSDLEDEHKAVMNEMADISSKPDMNSRMLEGLSKDFQSIKERLDGMEEEIEIASATAKGKGKQSEDVGYLREEIDFLRNSFVAREELEDAVSSVMNEVKSAKMQPQPASSGASSGESESNQAMAKDLQSLMETVKVMSEGLTSLNINMQSRMSALESDNERSSGQFTLLHDDIKGLLERQSVVEKRLAQIEDANAKLIEDNNSKDRDVKTADEQLKEREKAIRDLEKQHARALKEKEKELEKERRKAEKSRERAENTGNNTKSSSNSESELTAGSESSSKSSRGGFFSRIFRGSDDEEETSVESGKITDESSISDSKDEETLTVKRPEPKKETAAKQDNSSKASAASKAATKSQEKSKSQRKTKDENEKRSAQELIDELSAEQENVRKRGGKGVFSRIAGFFVENDNNNDDEDELY